MTARARIGCVEVSPGGPIAQGLIYPAPCINADPGGGLCNCGQRAAVRTGPHRIEGTRIPNIRRQADE